EVTARRARRGPFFRGIWSPPGSRVRAAVAPPRRGVKRRSVAVQQISAPTRWLPLQAPAEGRHLAAQLGHLIPRWRRRGLRHAGSLLRLWGREGPERGEGIVEAPEPAPGLEVHLQGTAHVSAQEVGQGPVSHPDELLQEWDGEQPGGVPVLEDDLRQG